MLKFGERTHIFITVEIYRVIGSMFFFIYSFVKTNQHKSLYTRWFMAFLPCNNVTCLRRIEYVAIDMPTSILHKNSVVVLYSPSFTSSVLLNDSKPSEEKIRLLSANFWGEAAKGQWYLEVRNALTRRG